MQAPTNITPAEGKLAVFLPGLGAVSTTFIAGCLLARAGHEKPIGSLTQMGNIRLGKRTENRVESIRNFVKLASLHDLEFAAWDIFPDDAHRAAQTAGVLSERHLSLIANDLAQIRPMPGVFYPEHVRRLTGTHVKPPGSKAEMVEAVRADIRAVLQARGCDRGVAVMCNSTEAYIQPDEVHATIQAFERGLARNDPKISSGQIYAWACLKERIPVANGTPSLCVDFPAAHALARETHTPIAGKDFKTGQTLLKTILAPGLKARLLGLRGWFSTNILGNRDGEVLDDPDNFRTKEVSKLGVLERILEPERHADLYGDAYHKVRINYYPPRGDAKESWDNIDITGWLGYEMQIKVNFLCRDSILAAPVVLDLALFLDLARRSELHGIQEWLGFYFKSPMAAPGLEPEHDLFIQLMKLKNTLRWLRGEAPLTHLGHEYYD